MHASMGIAEREKPVANAAFTNMACVVVLRDAIAAAGQLGSANQSRRETSDGMLLPRRRKRLCHMTDTGAKRGKDTAPHQPLVGSWPFGLSACGR